MAKATETSTTSRRGLIAAFAVAPIVGAVALPATPAIAEGDDSELFSLEAEIMRLTEQRKSIAEARINPHEQEFYRLLKTPYTESDRWIERVLGPRATKEGYKAACAFSEGVGRDSAMEEAEALFLEADPLIAALMGTPAKRAADRAAKVRVLLTCVLAEEWRGPASELNWEIELTRQLFGEFASLSESELAAI